MPVKTKSNKKKITWEDALLLYEEHLLARRAAKNTLAEHLRLLGHLRDHFGPLGPNSVTLADLRTYQAGLFTGSTSTTGKKLAPATVSAACSAIRRFFGFLCDDELIPSSPACRLEQPRVPKRAVGDVLTVKEIDRLLQAAEPDTPRGLRDRAMAELLYATGVRRAELLALDLGDLDHEERELVVRCGKGGKGRRLPVTRSAYVRVRNYLDEARGSLATAHPDSATALFVSQRGRRIDEMSLVRILRRLVGGAGIKKKVTGHTFRRTFATHLLQGGASLRHIQLLLGHADLSTTAVYLRLDTRELRRELLLKHPRERLEA